MDDLAGTDLMLVVADLAARGGGGDGLADTVAVNGTAGEALVQLVLVP